MSAFGVEAEEDVILVRGTEKNAREIELIFGEVGAGLQGLETLSVFEREDDDRRAVVLGMRDQCAKDRSHLLQLGGDVAGLPFAVVGENVKMGTVDLEPARRRVARSEIAGRQQQKENNGVLAHACKSKRKHWNMAAKSEKFEERVDFGRRQICVPLVRGNQ